MAIASVQAYLNGTWHTLTYNSGTGKYEATITAPGTTSWNQPGNVMPCRLKQPIQRVLQQRLTPQTNRGRRFEVKSIGDR